MKSETPAAPTSKKMVWAGRIVSAIPVLMLLVGGVVSLVKPDQVVEGLGHLGYPLQYARPLVWVEVACALVYLIPQTAVLGAVLLTGYLGGATASHVRLGEAFYFPIVFGVLVWLGVFLRDGRVRALLPLRRI